MFVFVSGSGPARDRAREEELEKSVELLRNRLADMQGQLKKKERSGGSSSSIGEVTDLRRKVNSLETENKKMMKELSAFDMVGNMLFWYLPSISLYTIVVRLR